MADRRTPQQRLVHAIEGAGAWLLFGLFRLLPVDAASAVGGFLARSIGPRLGATKRARLNLRRAMPELSDEEIERAVRGMWDNLGRVVAEYPHLDAFEVYKPQGRIKVEGIVDEIRNNRSPEQRYIFFSGHFGNWEIATLAATQAGFKVAEIYRAVNNPIVDRLISGARHRIGAVLLPKGPAAARGIIAAMQEGRHLCMLVDQKMNDGIAVPFFGRDAMTAPALARVALRFNCIVVPVRVERTKGAHFRLVADPALPLPNTGNAQADTLALMSAVNAALEGWIRARPDQWFWLHRRWPD
jgi:KDO2-lipid IV(A) lauroyltransferase